MFYCYIVAIVSFEQINHCHCQFSRKVSMLIY